MLVSWFGGGQHRARLQSVCKRALFDRNENMTSAFALVMWYAPRDSNPEPAD